MKRVIKSSGRPRKQIASYINFKPEQYRAFAEGYYNTLSYLHLLSRSAAVQVSEYLHYFTESSYVNDADNCNDLADEPKRQDRRLPQRDFTYVYLNRGCLMFADHFGYWYHGNYYRGVNKRLQALGNVNIVTDMCITWIHPKPGVIMLGYISCQVNDAIKLCVVSLHKNADNTQLLNVSTESNAGILQIYKCQISIIGVYRLLFLQLNKNGSARMFLWVKGTGCDYICNEYGRPVAYLPDYVCSVEYMDSATDAVGTFYYCTNVVPAQVCTADIIF